MIRMMQFLHYMQGRWNRVSATGQECYTVCSQDGQERKVMEQKFLDYLDGDEAGIKSVTVKITGMNAYGYLRSEKVFTVLSEFLHSMQQENDRHRLHPVM